MRPVYCHPERILRSFSWLILGGVFSSVLIGNSIYLKQLIWSLLRAHSKGLISNADSIFLWSSTFGRNTGVNFTFQRCYSVSTFHRLSQNEFFRLSKVSAIESRFFIIKLNAYFFKKDFTSHIFQRCSRFTSFALYASTLWLVLLNLINSVQGLKSQTS